MNRNLSHGRFLPWTASASSRAPADTTRTNTAADTAGAAAGTMLEHKGKIVCNNEKLICKENMHPTYDKRKEKVLAQLTEKDKWSLPGVCSFQLHDFLPK